MNIGIIGSGHVGLVTAACFADLGNHVICMDQDVKKIQLLKKGGVPIYEPGLSELLKKNRLKKRLIFTTSIREAVKFAEILFICVGTPPREGGDADLTAVEHVAYSIAACLTKYRLIVEKSTVPVETGMQLKRTIAENIRKNVPFDVASNPEFLREGNAVYDFFNPDRIVVGTESKRAEKILKDVYKPFRAPIIITDIRSAELIKHASNSFLAMKISFINMVGQICKKVGADVMRVAEGIGADTRISKSFLNPGIGFGGFCFPKDLSAFIRIGEKLGVPCNLLREVLNVNDAQKINFVKLVEQSLWNLSGKTVGVLGLSFKPDTEDMRFAPSIDIINKLQEDGVKIKAYDPQAIAEAKKVFKGIQYAKNPYDAVKGADAMLVLTEWNEFRELDLKKVKKLLKRPIVIDGRNIYSPAEMEKLGFRYYSIGR
ncbi:MAG: UDP-glucose 6-dehydrogenase [Omnitrophica bacterium RIFCSPLOWO2_12_FULL_44_17]|uniref:UDP-glucose 6-dehydrogenase n=1 Tax=Candidatus Danuiimicrobium aquiferis TaxID=1801832 RepID=A0A1G1KU26_9BACT|nr:MAG: UDP-glucose 6-dehydrogenase [Omnitrophica bacterium RIFCSPHIGHO2_02_FULL_45_28]OGW90187.1 MAG: UDP-glucose 6-dehydrogenase [Omnitrophica bacterium RIFCSPHIGHO2_12_FULL_44_12]OGW96355.1 MAG: UDP-glucose 6-dehydrogenase [Omnitrophica bacterium RIFCSPLOWO2_12_FULL_44_17]